MEISTYQTTYIDAKGCVDTVALEQKLQVIQYKPDIYVTFSTIIDVNDQIYRFCIYLILFFN